jgi:V8-like Glu-specific endopeptidase
MFKGIITTVISLTALSASANVKTICGPTDDRKLSDNPKIGRLSTEDAHKGCTATMISDSCAITAGHCMSVLVRAEFNTPESYNAEPQASAKEDVYYIDQDTIEYEYEGPGKDWAVFKFKPNKHTKKLPGKAQGYYDVNFNKIRTGSKLRITGYGVDYGDFYGNFAQQTHTGNLEQQGGLSYGATVLRHTVDTMGGNSGSSILMESTQEIIGIHTHGGCRASGGANMGTLISAHKKLQAAIKKCLASDR